MFRIHMMGSGQCYVSDLFGCRRLERGDLTNLALRVREDLSASAAGRRGPRFGRFGVLADLESHAAGWGALPNCEDISTLGGIGSADGSNVVVHPVPANLNRGSLRRVRPISWRALSSNAALSSRMVPVRERVPSSGMRKPSFQISPKRCSSRTGFRATMQAVRSHCESVRDE